MVSSATNSEEGKMEFQCGIYQNHPSIFINTAQNIILKDCFKLALVGRIFNGHPSMEDIRNSLTEIRIKGEVKIGLLSNHHFLIRFSNEMDMLKCWIKGSWIVQGARIRVKKWSSKFRPEIPFYSAPIWLLLPDLPCHLFNKEVLFSIATNIGVPISLDNPTAMLTRPKMAQIAVEVDLRKSRPEKIWIEDEEEGFWQKIRYNKVPTFCLCCNQFGHLSQCCKKNSQTMREPHQKTESEVVKEADSNTGILTVIQTPADPASEPSLKRDIIPVPSDSGKMWSSEEIIQMIQQLGNPVASGDLYRTKSSPIILRQWSGKKEQTLILQKADEQMDSLNQKNDNTSSSTISVEINFEEQVSPTPIEAPRKGRIKYQTRSEIRKKRERQETRKKEKQYEKRDLEFDWYSDTPF